MLLYIAEAAGRWTAQTALSCPDEVCRPEAVICFPKRKQGLLHMQRIIPEGGCGTGLGGGRACVFPRMMGAAPCYEMTAPGFADLGIDRVSDQVYISVSLARTRLVRADNPKGDNHAEV